MRPACVTLDKDALNRFTWNGLLHCGLVQRLNILSLRVALHGKSNSEFPE